MKNRKNKKYQSVITTRIVRSAHRLTVAVLVLAVFSGVISIGGTNAGFSDLEESTGNSFTATSLDGEATYIERFSVTGMKPGQEPDQRIIFSNVGNLDFRYNVKYRKTSGDDILCDAFLLTAERNGIKVYDKLPLKDFAVNQFPSPGTPFQIARSGEDTWDFTVELPADADGTLEHKSCQWDFDFTAWQTNLPDATDGFSDVESVGTHSIATGEWRSAGDVIINEVMWMGSVGDSDDEWIELKNMTASDINLSNWDIENGGSGSGHIEIPNGYSIKANGYFLITKKKWDETAIKLANDLAHDKGYTHVAGMSLLNGGEQLTLEDKDENVIDLTPIGEWPAGSHGSSTPLEQSMERNDIPGDGTLPANWHTCVSGVCNDGTYWDTVDGNNFGTPLASNLSPIVMNEFVPNPLGDDDADRPDGEWIELYNILDTPIDVAGWYFTNSDGDKIVITTANTASGETLVPGNDRLVVYLEQAFLGNDADTLSLYTPLLTPDVTTDDVQEDVFSYQDVADLPEGKSFARFPDGEGIWLDPEATPGEENVMSEEEMKAFRLEAYTVCFEGEKLKEDTTENICSPIFLTYIDMLKEADDTTITDSAILEILEVMRLAEEKKLAEMLAETTVIDTEIVPAIDTPVEESAIVDLTVSADETVPVEEDVPPVVTDEVVTPEPVVPTSDPISTEPVVVPEEEVTTPPEEPTVEEVPVDEIAPVEETPVVAPEEVPVIETPVN